MNDDSDNDEGFVPEKIQIKHDNEPKKRKVEKTKQRPADFLPRYIYGDGLYRKQPPEAYTRFQKFLSMEPITQKQQNKKLEKEELLHPSEKYYNNEKYVLVYARSKDCINLTSESDNFSLNQIPLNKICASYEPENYSTFKNFETVTQKNRQVEFDSRFECGNLLYAFKNKEDPNQFTLFIQNDTNTYGYNQWFNFSLRYTKPGVKYRFKIVNFKKRQSLFRQNMKISVFSLIDAQKNGGNGWRKIGKKIRYQRSGIRKYSDKKVKFYCLSFELQFDNLDDYIQIAMGIPYSYSRLIYHLKECEKIAQQKETIQWEMTSIAHSISNNSIPYLTITSKKPIQQKKKMLIFLARQHPGQTWASFMMEQIIYCLVQKCNLEQIRAILENYIIKVFPMINVDGVIYGNFRCDLGGFDLNRTWKDPSKILHPQVLAIKQQIARLSSFYQISAVFDLHGHSKQHNVFCYSCKMDSVSCRVLPYLISTVNPKFHFPYCTFGISRYKESTARAVIYNLIQNQNVLTIENSFYGSKINGNLEPFQPSFFLQFSEDMLRALYIFLFEKNKKKQIEKNIKTNLTEYISYERRGYDSGSESDPSGDEIAFNQKIGNIFPKSFISIEPEKDEEKVKKKRNNTNTNKNIEKKSRSKPAKNYQTLNQRPKPELEQKQTVQEPSKTFVQRASITYYKRNTSTSSKAHNQEKKKQKKQVKKQEQKNTMGNQTLYKPEIISKTNEISLPFYVRDKPQLIPIKLKNDSYQIFRDAYNATKTGEQPFRNTTYKAAASKKVKIIRGSDEPEEFPLLCVLSENKKKSHIQKTRSMLQRKQQSVEKKERKQLRSSQLESISSKNRQKHTSSQGKNAELISKIWRQNFSRYGKEMNIFFGGSKK